MSYPPEWPDPGKMHFRLIHERLGTLNLDCDSGYVVTAYNLGFPEIREVKLNNSLDHGTFDVTRFFGARAVSLDVTLKSHTGLTPASTFTAPEAYLRDRLIGYLYPGIRSRLLFSEHGDQRVRQMLIRGTSASIAVSKKEYNKVNVSWLAPRGTMSSYDERCYTYRFGELSGEFMDLVIVNEGTVPVDWRASISGWSIHPVFTLNGTETLAIEYDADPGDVITLDAFSRTITINGVPASYSYIGDSAVWFKIPPGFNTLRVAHAGGAAAFGYSYARWQEPGVNVAITDEFARANGPLGSDWQTPAVLPENTVAVDLAIDAGSVVVTVPDDGIDEHEWGFARNIAEITGGVGMYAELDVTNLAQASFQGPTARSHVELYTNMNDTDAACQALSVDFDYGIAPTPVAPVIATDSFDTLNGWDIEGLGIVLDPAGRNGSAMKIAGGAVATLDFTDAASTTVIVGAGIKVISNTTAIPGVRTLFEFRSDAGSTLHGKITVDPAGVISVYDANGVVKAITLAATMRPNVWHYVEVRFFMDAADGEAAVRVDGVDVTSAFGIDTAAGGTPAYAQIVLPSGVILYDDFYLATGDTAQFIGPLIIPNGSVAWEIHQRAIGGASGPTVASGTVPFNYTGVTARLRFESATEGEQRFLLNGQPIATEVDDDPVVGNLVGFGASYETFTYEPEVADFTDDFERAALGTDWTVPVPRTANKTVVLPTITTGAAVTTSHSGSYPQMVYTAASAGATLAGGIVQAMPSNLTAGYLCIARVVQTDTAGIPITASAGWTEMGTAAVGTPGGDFMESFENYGSWVTAGAATTVAARTGNGARLTGVGTSNHADFTLRTEDATVVIGFAWQISSLVAAVSEIVQWYSDVNVTQHNRLTVATNGSLSFWNGTTLLGTTAAGLITINAWNYVEVRTVLSDTVGAVTVRLNGTDVLTLTNVDTRNAGTKTVYDTIRLLGPVASMFNTFDDLYVVTGAAATFKGNQTIATSSGTENIRMSAFARIADGSSTDILTLTGGPTAWATDVESYWVQPNGYAGTAVISQMKFAMATGVTGFPDPPAVDLGAGTKDWMVMVSAGMDTQTSPTMTQSSGYSNTHSTIVSPGNLCALRSGHRTATLSVTENPGPYSGTTGRPWIAMTFAFPGGDLKWGGAENTVHAFDASETIAVEAVVNVAGTSGNPLVELYSHMVAGSSASRVLQVDMIARTWRLGHFEAVDATVVAASGSLPAGAHPYTIRLESDPDGTERFLFNGALVHEVLDATAPTPTVPTRVGFGEFWTTASSSPGPQIRDFAAFGLKPAIGPPAPPPTSPRIERFQAARMSGSDWAIPDRVVPLTDPTKPRPGAIRIEEDYWVKFGDDPDPPSPNGAPLVDYNGAGSGLFIYADGWTYDGYGWRDNIGRYAYPDGAVVPAVSNTPPNNPPPGGKPPWAWTPPVDPLTGQPSILTVHFCFYDQWI